MHNLKKDEALIELKKDNLIFIKLSPEMRSDREIILEAVKEEYNLRFLIDRDFQLYGHEINKIIEETRMKNEENDKKAYNLGKKIMWTLGIGSTAVSVGLGYLFSFSTESIIWITTACLTVSMTSNMSITYLNLSDTGRENLLNNITNNCQTINKEYTPIDYDHVRADYTKKFNDFATRSHTIPSYKVYTLTS